jgi:hypothetical protein
MPDFSIVFETQEERGFVPWAAGRVAAGGQMTGRAGSRRMRNYPPPVAAGWNWRLGSTHSSVKEIRYGKR